MKWRCSKCETPVRDGDGHILIMDRATGGYPKQPTPDPPELPSVLTAAALATQLVEPAIAFSVYHHRCDPWPDGAYWIAVERATTLEDWGRWVIHLSRKTWMSKIDVRRMLAFYYQNRELDVHAP